VYRLTRSWSGEQYAAYTPLTYFQSLQLLILRRPRDPSLHRPSCPSLLIQHGLASDEDGSGLLQLLHRCHLHPAPLLPLLCSLLCSLLRRRHRHDILSTNLIWFYPLGGRSPERIGPSYPPWRDHSGSRFINAMLIHPVALLQAATFFFRYAHPVTH
jgi:hypothetical protein